MSSTLLNRLVMLFSALGIFIAGALTISHTRKEVLPCVVNRTTDCSDVQSSAAAVFMGIPIAAIGLGAYIVLLALAVWRSMSSGSQRRSIDIAGLVLAGSGGVISLGLQVYSFAFLHKSCDWCIASAVTMVVLAVLHGFIVQIGGPEAEPGPRPSLDFGLVAVLAVSAVVGLTLSGGMGRPPANRQPLKTDKLGGADPKELLLRNANAIGPETAPFIVVEFADLYCPACKVSFGKMKELVGRYPTKVRWVFRHYPLYFKKGFEMSLPAAMISEYAAESGRFWPFVAGIYEGNPEQTKTLDGVLALVSTLNLDADKARSLVASTEGKEFDEVYADMELGSKLGVIQTPTFVVLEPGKEPSIMDAKGFDSWLAEPAVQRVLNQP